MAASIIPQSRDLSNLNSGAECVTASKPTNAHGIIARMRRTWVALSVPFGENAGAITASPPSLCHTATPKHAEIDTIMKIAQTVWILPAKNLCLRQQNPAMTIIKTDSIASPKYTSKPATVECQPNCITSPNTYLTSSTSAVAFAQSIAM